MAHNYRRLWLNKNGILCFNKPELFLLKFLFVDNYKHKVMSQIKILRKNFPFPQGLLKRFEIFRYVAPWVLNNIPHRLRTQISYTLGPRFVSVYVPISLLCDG
jgi:hypothetical protein